MLLLKVDAVLPKVEGLLVDENAEVLLAPAEKIEAVPAGLANAEVEALVPKAEVCVVVVPILEPAGLFRLEEKAELP